MKRLLAREEVNLDKPGHTGQTPLAEAANKGQAEVVKILLRRVDVDPNKRSNNSGTPLSRPAWNGHEGVVKAPLERVGVKTPLRHAASNGYEEVKLLLRRKEVNSDRQDNEGKTPFFWWC